MLRPLESVRILVASLALAACGSEPETRPIPEPRIATLEELDRAIRTDLGTGALINFWATW